VILSSNLLALLSSATFAKETTKKQSLSFQRYGVTGNWQHTYLTLHPQYEASQICVFGEMFKRGPALQHSSLPVLSFLSSIPNLSAPSFLS
jgi:isoleucyl-tRNA synthetase